MPRRSSVRRGEASDEMAKDPVLLPRINMPMWLKPEFELVLFKKNMSGDEKRAQLLECASRTFALNSRGYRLIKRADETVEREFAGKLREDGEDYLDHLRESALIAIVHLHIRDANIIAAILLHDIIEDVEGWTWVRLKNAFNKQIARYVRRNTKPEFGSDKYYKTKEDRDRAFRKQIWKSDHASVVVKLVERLHNLIKMWRTGEERIREKVRESRWFYLRLARRERVLALEYKYVLAFINGQLDK